MDSGPPKIVQMDSFNPSFNPDDDYDRKLEPGRTLPQPKENIWGDIHDLRNELNSKFGQISTSHMSSHPSCETKVAFTRMGTNDMVDIRTKEPSTNDLQEGPPPITQMETMNVTFSPNDDYNGQLAGNNSPRNKIIQKTKFSEQSEAMQMSLDEEIVERRHRESVKAEVNPYYMMSYQQGQELDVGPQPIIHIDTLRPMFKLDDEGEGGLADLCAEVVHEETNF